MTEIALDPNTAFLCEIGEAMAGADLYRAMAESPTNEYRATLAEVAGLEIGSLAALNMGFFNRVVGLGVNRPATREDVDAVVDFYRGLGQTNVTIQVAPHARPADLRAWLVDRDFVRGRSWAKVWRETSDPLTVDTSLRIEEIGPDHVGPWSSIVATAFELPAAAAAAEATIGRRGWQHYLGFDGSVPVTAAAMFIVEHAGAAGGAGWGANVAWLGFGATLPEARGRGGQSAMFTRRLADAAQLGCRIAITETGEDTPEEPNPSYRNMIRTGFHLAYLRPNFNLTAAAS
jgi:GNAT superfamily N-acetyltransferase